MFGGEACSQLWVTYMNLIPHPEKLTWQSRLGSVTAIGGPPHRDTVVAFKCQMSMLLFLSWCSQWDNDKQGNNRKCKSRFNPSLRVLTLRGHWHRRCWELWSPTSMRQVLLLWGGREGKMCKTFTVSKELLCPWQNMWMWKGNVQTRIWDLHNK